MGFRNMYIAASAGSGKTYQLVNRFIALLSLQKLQSGHTDVSRLIAVTFTRKASGEFKGRILAALGEAAKSPKAADKFWEQRILPTICDRETGICPDKPLPPLPPLHEFFSSMLRELTDDFSKLNLSTIDSFFQRMVVTLGPELGLGSSATMDDAQLAGCMRASLDLSYLPQAGGEGDSSLEAAIRDFCPKPGMLENPDKLILKHVEDFHEAVLDSPSALWGGNPDELSDEQLALFHLRREDITIPLDAEELRDARETMKRCLAEQVKEDPKTNKNIIAYVESLAQDEGKPESRPADRNKKWGCYLERCRGVGVDVDEVALAKRALYWRGLMMRTAALQRLVLEFDRCYKSSVRDRGMHVFADIPRLLLEHADAESVMRMQERTDAQLDHWMLDEFQDTSHIQYAVLHDILANRVSDGEGSVFMVGDAKQSIYQFRGGDPQIFINVRRDLFGIGDEGATESVSKPLDTSFRSSTEVLEFTNAIFSDIERTATRAHAETRANWQRLGYQPHTCAPCNADMPGCAAIYQAPTAARLPKEKNEPIYDALAALLAQHRPAGTGQPVPSCAILVRRNKDVEKIFSALNARQGQYGFEGPLVMCNDCEVGSDSPAGLALTRLFRWLNCPADERSLSQLRLTPLWKSLCREFGGGEPAVASTARRQQVAALWQALQAVLSAVGVSGLLRRCIRLCPDLRGNDFIRQRMGIWLNAADAFDSQGGSLSEWLDEAEQLLVRGEPQGNAIRIMTTFQAKGLEYDMVLLPQFITNRMANYTKAKFLKGCDGKGGEAILLPPAWDELVAMENVYHALFVPWLAAQEFAELCVLYVAVTRAKHATYTIIPDDGLISGESVNNIMRQVAEGYDGPPAAEEGSTVPARCLYRLGSEDWSERWRAEHAVEVEDEAAPQAVEEKLDFHFPSLIRTTPSGKAAAARKHGQPVRFGQKGDGTHFGIAVHAAFEQVAWLEEGEEPAFPTAADAEAEAAQATVRRALTEPAVRALFKKPAAPCRLFREQGIEALRRGREWVSGQIDRLVVEYADAAYKQPLRALIIDFKSDRCEAAALKPEYAPQMKSYREMVALAFGLPEAAVGVTLIHAPRVGAPSTQPYAVEELQ